MITVNKAELIDALSATAGAISSRPAITTLQNVHVSISNMCMTLTATDLSIAISQSVDAQSADCYKFAVDHAMFSKVVKSAVGEIDLEVLDSTVVIKSDGRKIKLPTISSADYPEVVMDNAEVIAECSATELSQTISNTVYACHTMEHDVLSSLHFSFDDVVHITGTDGYRIATSNIACDTKRETCAMISAKHSESLSKALAGKCNCTIALSDTKMVVRTDDLCVMMSLKNGTYPNIRPIINQAFNHEVNVISNRIMDGVKSALLISTESDFSMNFIFGKDLTIVSTSEHGDIEFKTGIECDFELDAKFNTRFIYAIFSHIDDADVNFKIILQGGGSFLLVEHSTGLAFVSGMRTV